MNPPPTSDMKRRALLDLIQRAKGGVLLHLVMWLLIGLISGLAGRSPWLFWAATLVFGLAFVARWWGEPRLEQVSLHEPTRARFVFLVLLLVNPFTWGLVCAAEIAQPSGTPAADWIWFTLTGVAASGGIALAIDPAVRLLYAPSGVLPPVAVMVWQWRGDQSFHVAAAILFLLYVRRSSMVVHADYWTAAHARVELEQRARQLEAMNCTDTLTRVANRLHFDQLIEQEWGRARREANPVALMMIDIDHFKQVNDDHGHAFGDTCLQAIATALRRALIRPGDLLARYGGEEFVVMLPGTDVRGAEVVAARLLAAVAGLTLTDAGRAVPVTCSIGVHVVEGPGLGSPAAALKRADQALYQAKHLGRNRVVMLGPVDPRDPLDPPGRPVPR